MNPKWAKTKNLTMAFQFVKTGKKPPLFAVQLTRRERSVLLRHLQGVKGAVLESVWAKVLGSEGPSGQWIKTHYGGHVTSWKAGEPPKVAKIKGRKGKR